MYKTKQLMKILFWLLVILVFSGMIIPSVYQIYYFFEGSKNLQWNHVLFSTVMIFIGCYLIRLLYKKIKSFVKYYEQFSNKDFN